MYFTVIIPEDSHLLIEVQIRHCRPGNHSRSTIERKVLDCPLNENENRLRMSFGAQAQCQGT